MSTRAEDVTRVPERAASAVGRRIGWFAGGVVLCAWLYAAMVTSSVGFSTGGYSADGYVDAAGEPTDAAPLGIHVSTGPSAALLFAVALTAVAAISIAVRRARQARPEAAIAILDRAQMALALVTLLSAVTVTWWVGARAVDSWDGTQHYDAWSPTWLAAITVDLSEQP